MPPRIVRTRAMGRARVVDSKRQGKINSLTNFAGLALLIYRDSPFKGSPLKNLFFVSQMIYRDDKIKLMLLKNKSHRLLNHVL